MPFWIRHIFKIFYAGSYLVNKAKICDKKWVIISEPFTVSVVSMHCRLSCLHRQWRSVHNVSRKLGKTSKEHMGAHIFHWKSGLHSLHSWDWFWWCLQPKMESKMSQECPTASLDTTCIAYTIMKKRFYMSWMPYHLNATSKNKLKKHSSAFWCQH